MRVPLVSQSLGLGRRVSSAAADAVGRAGLAGLDALLEWRYTDEAVKRVLASPVADHAVGHALRGPLVDAVARDLAQSAVLESPAMERLATEVIESRLLDTIVERLLESEELWIMVDEIARSPAVTDAIGQQSVGFADQVAGQVRVRSQRADASIERVARRLLRRSR
ncbi:MAG TPA: hypothetical protein VGF21_03690 [Thermoleophilaceae bacterium]|jgi:hypothetical protein